MAKKQKECSVSSEGCRLGKVGGQAVLEGVMMKAGNRTVTSCRKGDGSIVVNDDSFVSVRKKHKFLNIPILRGVINFVEMMALSIKTLNASADALGIEEEEGKVEKWLKKHFGIGIVDVIMVIGVVLGLALSLFLFMFLPIFIADLINKLAGGNLGAWQKVIEGVLKAAIFVTYLWLVSLMPDIKRTFMYHGAEHKTIACFEAGEELTPENAMKHTRFHPRCGTSFMFFMILLGIVAGLIINYLIPGLDKWAYTGIRLLVLPLVMGIGYEFIMFAGKHDNFFTRTLSAPGLWVQRLTTKEPTLDMLEVAICSTKCALRDEFSEFKDYFDAKGWEKKTEEAAAETDGESVTEDDLSEVSAELEEAEAEAEAETSVTDENTEKTENTESTAAKTPDENRGEPPEKTEE